MYEECKGYTNACVLLLLTEDSRTRPCSAISTSPLSQRESRNPPVLHLLPNPARSLHQPPSITLITSSILYCVPARYQRSEKLYLGIRFVVIEATISLCSRHYQDLY